MENTEVAKEAKAPAAPVAIIRGRMPVAVVALIRFGDNKGGTTKELATKFGTTVGKIDDIKKNRNFAYVTADFKPTADQKAVGFEWLKKHPDYDGQDVDKLVSELEATPEATAEEAAAFEAVRVAARGQSTTTKDGAEADAGGGNRRGKKAKEPKVEGGEAAAPTEDALLN